MFVCSHEVKLKMYKMHWHTSRVVYLSRNCHGGVMKMNDDNIS